MVNANEKWEPVEQGDLKIGDSVRMTHTNGTVIFGECYEPESFGGSIYVRIKGPYSGWAPLAWSDWGYTVERAVPERTLPTEPGVYVSATQYQAGDYDIFTLGAIAMTHGWAHTTKVGKTQRADEVFLPDDLVRLVPVTEVDELRQRISAAKSYIRGTWGGQSVVHDRLIDVLDGESVRND